MFKPIEYCEYCGRKTITRKESFGPGTIETWVQCPRWDSIWSLFTFQKHSLQLLGFSTGYLGKYNPYTGFKNGQ